MNEITKQLLICLVASHFVGDFIFQSDKDASNKLRPLILLKHSFIVADLKLCALRCLDSMADTPRDILHPFCHRLD